LVADPQAGGKSPFFPVGGRGRDAFNVLGRREELNGGRARAILPAMREQATAD
jgi:hypothetical protein